MDGVKGTYLRRLLEDLKAQIEGEKEVFDDSLYRFPDEEKDDPREVARRIAHLEDRIVAVQTLQAVYNQSVTVELEGVRMTLTQAIKAEGAAERQVALWKGVNDDRSRRNYLYRAERSSKKVDEVTQERVVPPKEAARLYREAAARVSRYKEIINEGNNFALDISADWLDESLLAQ